MTKTAPLPAPSPPGYNGPVVRRAIYVDLDRLDNELDAATARKLARNLIAAADELDELTEATVRRLAGTDSPCGSVLLRSL